MAPPAKIITNPSSTSGTQSNIFFIIFSQDYQFHSFEAKHKLISHSLGWGMLPEHFISNQLASGALQKIKVADKKCSSTFPFYLIKNKSKMLGPVATEIWNAFSELKL
ncbi:LysR substrate-binding domain-containing protein [Paraglaciecola sp.]|uniref:LysR substrate-binding domain-containing protein n=1 Tax=Paraglaciecola sp. TaxID=1920173 RepID=UPI00387E650A